MNQGKPLRYRSIAPAKAVERLRSIIDEDSAQVLKYLEEDHAMGKGLASADAVWTIRGIVNLCNKFSDIVNDAENSIILIAPDPLFFEVRKNYPIFNGLLQIIKNKLASGVAVRIVCPDASTAEEILKETPNVEVRMLDPDMPSSKLRLTGGVLLVDDSEALISIVDGMSLGKEITAIHTRIGSITSVLRHFMEVEWDAALPIKTHSH